MASRAAHTCSRLHPTSSSLPLKPEPSSSSERCANKQHTVARCAFRDGPRHASVVTSGYLRYRCLSCHRPGCSPCDLEASPKHIHPWNGPWLGAFSGAIKHVAFKVTIVPHSEVYFELRQLMGSPEKVAGEFMWQPCCFARYGKQLGRVPSVGVAKEKYVSRNVPRAMNENVVEIKQTQGKKNRQKIYKLNMVYVEIWPITH